MINQTHDFPTDDEDSDHEGVGLSSYEHRISKINRIWLPGTPASRLKSRTPKPRESGTLRLREFFDDQLLAIQLPDLSSSNASTSSE